MNIINGVNPINPVMLVEDEDDYATLIRESLLSVGIQNPVLVVHTPQSAIAYLDPEGTFSDRSIHPLPSLMLLDLNFPEHSGFDVLRWLNSHPTIKVKLQVVVLSGLIKPEEIQKAYDLGAQFYMNKQDYLEPEAMARFLKKCWLSAPSGGANTA